MPWTDGWWRSADGLRLHYRDYPGCRVRTPVLCIPGLTRNARDFEPLAARLSGESGRRVIVTELRGRGLSDFSPDPEDYHPGRYVADIAALLDSLALDAVAMFGTSLGGIVTMLLGATGEPRIAGFLLNDIGPIIAEAGLKHIRGHVGTQPRWPDWDAAATAIAATHARTFPDHRGEDWQRMARQLCREDEGGAIVTDYDPAIALVTARPTPVVADPWALFAGLAGRPGLLVRGGLSDILDQGVAQEMIARLPEIELVTLPRVGHAPTHDEPAAVKAIDRLLARIDARA